MYSSTNSEATHRPGLGSRRSSGPVWWKNPGERDHTVKSPSRKDEAPISNSQTSVTDAAEKQSKCEANLLKRIMLEGGGIHFQRDAPQTFTPQDTPSPSVDSETSSASSRAAKRKQLQKTAADALRNEEQSNINKLSPVARAKGMAQLADMDDSPNNEILIRDLVDAGDGKRKRRRRRRKLDD